MKLVIAVFIFSIITPHLVAAEKYVYFMRKAIVGKGQIIYTVDTQLFRGRPHLFIRTKADAWVFGKKKHSSSQVSINQEKTFQPVTNAFCQWPKPAHLDFNCSANHIFGDGNFLFKSYTGKMATIQDLPTELATPCSENCNEIQPDHKSLWETYLFPFFVNKKASSRDRGNGEISQHDASKWYPTFDPAQNQLVDLAAIMMSSRNWTFDPNDNDLVDYIVVDDGVYGIHRRIKVISDKKWNVYLTTDENAPQELKDAMPTKLVYDPRYHVITRIYGRDPKAGSFMFKLSMKKSDFPGKPN